MLLYNFIPQRDGDRKATHYHSAHTLTKMMINIADQKQIQASGSQLGVHRPLECLQKDLRGGARALQIDKIKLIYSKLCYT